MKSEIGRRRMPAARNFEAPLALGLRAATPPRDHGAVAQLGERLNGIQEVVGSIPISSTNRINKLGRPERVGLLFAPTFPPTSTRFRESKHLPQTYITFQEIKARLEEDARWLSESQAIFK